MSSVAVFLLRPTGVSAGGFYRFMRNSLGAVIRLQRMAKKEYIPPRWNILSLFILKTETEMSQIAITATLGTFVSVTLKIFVS